ncbi:MAG: MarC family protein [Bacteriovoracaceae bacterium]
MKEFLIYFVGIFAVVDPLGVVPFWLSLAEKLKPETRIEVIKKTVFYVFIILFTFLVIGNAILKFFNISLVSIRIAGGIMLFIEAITLIKGTGASHQLKNDEIDVKKVAFTPLAMPLLSGPGSIAVILGISGNLGYLWDSPFSFFYAILAILCVSLIIFIILLSSNKLRKYIPITAINSISHFMGFILLSISVQFLIDSFIEILKTH